MAGIVTGMSRDLLTACRRTTGKAPLPVFTEAEKEALLYTSLLRSLPLPGSPSKELEVRIYSYRLIIAAPWADRNAMPDHTIASAFGKVFGAVRAREVDSNLIRDPYHALLAWAEKWQLTFAAARRSAIIALSPTIPRV